MTKRLRGTLRLAALVALAAPVFAACSVNDQTMGVRGDNPHGKTFNSYVAIGTSIGAGFQSNGINDSTQQQSYAVLVARALGFTPGVDWFYPSLRMPGCPAPYTNPLTGARVGGANSSTFCALRNTSPATPFINNVSVPGIRLAQILNIDTIPYGVTDTLKLDQFITAGRNPVDMAAAEHATFITWESFANDVLGGATHQDTTILTPLATFTTYANAAAAAFDAMGAKVVVVNVPNVTVIPFFSAGQAFWCLNNGLCPGIPATPPYNSPKFSVGASCAPSALGGVGDSMLVGFPATGAITSALAAGAAAHLACDTGYATITTTATTPVGPVLSKAVTITVATRVAQFNATLANIATTHGYALVDLNAIIAAARQGGLVPTFPNFANPSALFGPLITLDGVHPSAVAHKILADSIVSAINAKFSPNPALTLP